MRNPRTASITQPPTGLYQGYDSFLGQVRDVAISGTSNQVNAQSTILVSVCTDTDSVTEALNISGGLSGSFSDVSFAAKASWAESLSLTSTSVAVIVHSVIITGETQANSYALSITPPSDVQGFFADYGDSFVSEIVLGGEYYAAFVFDSVTVGQQQQIQVQVSGSGGPLSASLSTTINTASTSTQTSLRTSQQMLGVSTPSFPNADPDSIVTFALSFGSQSINAPTVLCYAVTGYEHVASVPAGFQSVVSNRNLLGTASSTPFVQASATLSSLSSQVATIQQMYSAYGYSGDTLFAANAAQVSQDVTALNQLITSIEANATGTYTAP